jgi:hypothetical protein
MRLQSVRVRTGDAAAQKRARLTNMRLRILSLLSPVADIALHTLRSAPGQQETPAAQQRAPAATSKWPVPRHSSAGRLPLKRLEVRCGEGNSSRGLGVRHASAPICAFLVDRCGILAHQEGRIVHLSGRGRRKDIPGKQVDYFS